MSLVSRYTPAEFQGLAQGTFRSMASLSRAGGPLLGALCYWKFGSLSPYLAGTVFLLLPLVLAFGLPAPAGEGSQGPQGAPSGN